MQETEHNSYNETIQHMFSNSQFQDSYLFYACLLSKCTLIFDNTMNAPAGVSFKNSYQLHINPEKFKNYSLINRLAILKHEMLHIINGHLTIRNDYMCIHEYANIAMDCSINQLIDLEHLPENCILPETLEKDLGFRIKRLESSEYYYDLIVNNKEKINITDGEHQTWENSDIDENIVSELTSEMLEDAKETTLLYTGNLPGDYSKWINLYKKTSEFNWKKLLKLGLKSADKTRTIFKPNRNYPDRMDLKGKKKNKINEVLYIIDASGSVKNSEFKELNSEIISLCALLKLKITAIQVDTEASEPEILTKNTSIIERTKNKGTFLSKGLYKANEHKIKYDTIIVSTDGYLSYDDIKEFVKINKNIIFLISKKGSTHYIEQYKTNKIKIIQIS